MSLLSSLIPAPMKGPLRATRTAFGKARQSIRRRMTRPNLYELQSAERVGVVFTAPSDMRIDERLFLYSLVRGFMPERVLEIGVLNGGGGCIMANAMQENGFGKVIGLDPAPELKVTKRSLHERYEILTQPSPNGIAEARERVGGAFDFVLVDGLHLYDQVVRDIDGLMPHLTDGAYVLFHDAFHYGVSTAIAEAVGRYPNLTDCGYVCRTANPNADPHTPYNGFRLLRHSTDPVVDASRAVAPCYTRAGKTAPPFDRAVLNHDVWYCRKVEP